MATRRFLVLLIGSKELPNPSAFVDQLDKALDWIRLTSTSWLLFTSKDASTWYGRIGKISEGKRVFITEIDASQRSGFMPRSVWAFIRKHQDELHPS